MELEDFLTSVDRRHREFVREARSFLDEATERRPPAKLRWGEEPENLALFHETRGAEELAEVKEAKEWQQQRWRAGFGWITGPPRYGGRGSTPESGKLYQTLEEYYVVPDMSALRIGFGSVSPTIVEYGTDEQIREYAVPIQAGTMVACQLFSEPEAGSDLAGVRTRAIRDGDGWVLSGQKVWSSNAHFADIGLALVRSDPEEPKHAGLTAFLVPMDQAGVVVRRLRQMTGGASFNEVFLDDAWVPDDLRLGGSGAGWSVAKTALSSERSAVGDRFHPRTARAVAMLQVLCREYGDSDVHRQELVDIDIRLRIAKMHRERMEALSRAEGAGAQRVLDKLLLSDNLRRIGELAGRLLGPHMVADSGRWGTYAWSKWLLSAPGYRIGGGTDEVLRNLVAEQLLGLPRGDR